MTASSPGRDEREDSAHFDGHPGRDCGEHRTVGAHRAWCYSCQEWCYPRAEGGCRGCEGPRERAELARLYAVEARARAYMRHVEADRNLNGQWYAREYELRRALAELVLMPDS